MSRDTSLIRRIPRRWLFLALFFLLVFSSNAWRKAHPYSDPLPPGATFTQVREFDRTRAFGSAPATIGPTGDMLKVAVRDIPADTPGAPTVLLIHGVPGDSGRLDPLVAALKGKVRLLVPDLPGFGASTPDVDNYGVAAQAHAMLDLLDARKVKGAHLIAFGQGGGVALNLAHLAPSRVKSLSLISSIGAQEYDLMGNPVVNLVVYAYHYGVFKLWQDAVPHFGLFDRFDFNKNYARALWDSDLSDLKKSLREYRGPLLLAHGEDDWCVAADTARYSAVIAPQAETLFVPGGHRVFTEKADEYAPRLADFVTRAETGAAASATHDTSMKELPPAPAAKGAHHAVLMLIILGCTLVAEDPTCLATGLLVAAGLIDFWSGTAACLVGIFIGDLFLYMLGFVLGRAALRRAPLKWLISEYEVDRMSVRFGSTKGMAVIVTSRFIPGSRIPTFVAAGIMRLNPVKLGSLFFIAAALWTPPLVLLAEHVGGGVMEDFKKYHHLAGYIAIGLLVAIFVLFHYVVPAFTWLGRRKLKAKFRAHMDAPDTRKPGLTDLLHHLALGVRHGGFATFACANPGLGELGGVAGESKSLLMTPFAGRPQLAPFVKIAAGDPVSRRAALAGFVAGNALAYPLVLKPDVAEGGVGARIVRDAGEAEAWLDSFAGDALAQPFVSGREYELVWNRAPEAAEGRLVAVVEKRLVAVHGDGKHTLEHLIWASDEALDNAELFLRLNAGREDSVPAAGDTVTLCEIGSVAKGARATVRHGLADAPGANAAVNALTAGAEGVTWLRLDVRAESDEAFSAGMFTVTEIEGAGRLPSALRDPEMRLADIRLFIARRRGEAFAAGAAMLRRRPGMRRPMWLDTLATRGRANETQEPR